MEQKTEFTPYGVEWQKELKSKPKDFLVDFLRNSLIKISKLESELKNLRLADVNMSVCYCGKPSVEECEPCCSLACALKDKDV